MAENTPNIRFKGVAANWSVHEIGDVITEKKRPVVLDDNATYQLITVKRRNEGVVSRGFLKGKQILVKNYFEVKAGDYVISKRQVVHGANGIVPEKLDGAIVSNEYLVATENDNITTEFLTLISKLPDMYKKFFISSYGIDIEKLVFDVDDWKKRKLSIPDTDEQKKLTSFFKDFDKLNAAEQQKYDKLISFKKSMLDKMFPKGKEKVPVVRFHRFNEAWDKIEFSQIAKVKRGLTYKPTDIQGNGVRVLRSSNINEDQFILHMDDVFVSERAVNIDLMEESNILITSANGSTRLVGKHAVVTNISNKKTVHGGFMLAVQTKEPFFLNASMSSSWYLKFVNKNVAGGNGAIGNLSKSDLEQQEFLIPNEKEQVEIGKFFKNVDSLIALQKEKLQKLTNIKKAFLEKMFL